VILGRSQWDSEAKVWVATSDDVVGSATEDATPDELAEKLQVMIPELLEANGETGDGLEVPLFVMSEQVATVRLSS
jgi:predicted RNase H-like HicB family nuclease